MPASAFLSALYKMHSDLETALKAQDAADTVFQNVSALAASAAVNYVCHKALQLMPVFMSSTEAPLSKDSFLIFFFVFWHLYSTNTTGHHHRPWSKVQQDLKVIINSNPSI